MPRGNGTGPAGHGRSGGRGMGRAGEKAEAVWAAHLLQARGEIVSAQNAAKKCRTLSENHVITKLVPSAGQE